MARIPDSAIEQLKLQVPLLAKVEAAGIALKRHGKDWVGRCPWHDDQSPSLVVSPKYNLWHCLGACQAGGSVIDWVMRFEGVGFREAMERLRAELGGVAAEAAAGNVTKRSVVRPGSEVRDAGSGQAAVAASDEQAAASAATEFPPLAAEALSPADTGEADQALLRRVIDYYQATLQRSPVAKAYLAKRGLEHPELIAHFQLGYADRSLGLKLGSVQSQAGAARKAQLLRLGVFRESGHEHFNGSLVVPVITAAGEISEVYGRKVGTRLREGTAKHLYLPGPHRGVFNEAGLVGQEEAILCEALIDALTFWCAGYRHVTASYGAGGFTADHLAAFRRHGIKRVLIAYDANAAGNAAADTLAPKLLAEGFECYRCRFPKGMDANEYALEVKPAAKALGLVLRQAQWLGEGAAPERSPLVAVAAATATAAAVPEQIPSLTTEHVVQSTVAMPEAAPSTTLVPAPGPADMSLLAAAPAVQADVAAQAPAAVPAAVENAALPLSEPVPALSGDGGARQPDTSNPEPATSNPDAVHGDGDELRLTLGDRDYTVRGIDDNRSNKQLRVLLRASRGEQLHVDTLDLYQPKQRAAWIKAVSLELGVADDIVRADYGKLLRATEDRQEALIKRQLKPGDGKAAPALTPAQQEAGLALLRDPQLIERIVKDVEATGVVGEASNALVAYLACVSRKLDKPLAILIQSTSAAGKSTLMDAVLALMPEAERVQYSAMTGQSLFYLGEQTMRHKILAIAEEEGVRQAAYALKLLQSQGELTIASTGKDPTTGDLQTKTYTVEGPVMLFLTTTATDVEEELQNRCLVLAIDESREQTAAIQARQRQARTLEGLRVKRRAERVLATHRAAQQLLRPLAVVNPFAEQLGFATDRVRLRRDQQKYLALIDAIALLHQQQRPVRSMLDEGETVEYVEVMAADITLANRLAHEVLGRSLDELPPPTRRLLGTLQRFVAERAQAQGVAPTLLRFTRRELRAYANLSDTQLRAHLERLVELEYVLAHAGRNGQRFVYELVFDGDVASERPQAVGLIDVEALQSTGTTSNLAAPNTDLAVTAGNLAGSLRPASGDLAATLRRGQTPRNASADAEIPVLVAADAKTAVLGESAAPRRNGASYSTAPGQ